MGKVLVIVTRAVTTTHDSLEAAQAQVDALRKEPDPFDETITVNLVEGGILRDHFTREPKAQT